MPKFVSNINLPESTNAGFNALTAPATQAYPYAQVAPGSPGEKLRQLSNTTPTMYTVEYSSSIAAGSGLKIFQAASGVAGVVEKIRLIGSSNSANPGLDSCWLRIFYSSVNTGTPAFVADIGTLFLMYPGATAGTNNNALGGGPFQAFCSHMETQQMASPVQSNWSVGNSSFWCMGCMKYPIPFTNGIYIEIFNPLSVTTSLDFTEVLVAECPVAQVPPYQLQCMGSTQIPSFAYTSGLNITAAGTQAAVEGWTISTAEPMLGAATSGANNVPILMTPNQIGQLAKVTGQGWAVGLSYSARTPSGAGLTYLERNFAWYIDGAATTQTVSAATNVTTAVTVTIPSVTGVGFSGGTGYLTVTGASGGTWSSINGTWAITSINTSTNQVTFSVTTAPTGAYTASTASVSFVPQLGQGATTPAGTGVPVYGGAVGAPTMETSGTEDTFDSCYYAFDYINPHGILQSANYPAFPASGTAIMNSYGFPVDAYIQAAGPISVININGTNLPMTLAAGESKMITLPQNCYVTFTYQGTAATWAWVQSSFPDGGPTVTYSQPTAMATGNGGQARGGCYNTHLDILESCGGYRFNTGLQLWLLTESRVADNEYVSWTLLYYIDQT